MKLKLVVASMSVLGLVSASAFAAEAPMNHKHHKHHYHHVVKRHPVAAVDYKSMGALPVVETCPVTTPYGNVLDAMNQNLGRAKPTEDCNKLIAFAGGINLDAHWGNRNIAYQGKNRQRLSLNDAYLNIFGNVNDWTKGFASLSYGDPSGINSDLSTGTSVSAYPHRYGQYSNVYTAAGQNKVTLEQGFIRIANFDESPFFVELGKQFADFGRYMSHPVTRSVTQSLTETLATSAKVGFVTPMGFHGDVYAFDNPIAETNGGHLNSHTKTNYGAALGYDMPNDQLGWGLNVGYLYNMTGVNDVAQLYQTGVAASAGSANVIGAAGTGGYSSRVGAVAVDAMVNSGPFSVIGDYVVATNRFSAADGIVKRSGSTRGAKPWAGNLQAGYNFNQWSRNQNIYVGYQVTGDSVYFNLPKHRWTVGWNADVWKNTNLGIELGRDTDYSRTDGGSGNSSGTVGVRAAIKFG